MFHSFLDRWSQENRWRSRSTILLAGWAANLSPQMALVRTEAGEAGRLVQPLQGVPVLRTDLNGWIYLTTNGEQMGVEVERKISE